MRGEVHGQGSWCGVQYGSDSTVLLFQKPHAVPWTCASSLQFEVTHSVAYSPVLTFHNLAVSVFSDAYVSMGANHSLPGLWLFSTFSTSDVS